MCVYTSFWLTAHTHIKLLRDSQLVDDPQQAVPAGGALVLQLVVVEEQQGAQHLPAADDGGHILEGRSRPGEAGHCGRQKESKLKRMRLHCQHVSYILHWHLFTDPLLQVCRRGAWLGW